MRYLFMAGFLTAKVNLIYCRVELSTQSPHCLCFLNETTRVESAQGGYR